MTTTGFRAMVGMASALVVLIGLAVPAGAEPIAQRDFENPETWSEGLYDLRALDFSRTSLDSTGYAGQGLRVRIPEGGFRGFGPFDRLPLPEPAEAWYRYHIRLLDWRSASSGKLPGLSGIYSKSGKGCIPSTEASPGWSARGIFGAAGTQGAPAGAVPIGTYLYHLDQAGTCGDGLYWPGAYLEQGRWQCVEGHVKLNTPGLNDGSIDGWLDGVKLFSKNGLAFRRAGEPDIGIREMWLNIYFGGSYPTPNPLSLEIDQVVVSDTGRVGCLDPFADDNGTLFEDALTELHARGLLNGCGYRLACPTDQLSRGEAAALFSRVLRLPPAGRDYFTDDGSSVFEGAINRLAQAGVTVGCTASEFCPERVLTRAEFAVMTVRAMKLKPSSEDFFGDDNDYWAEAAINAFAEAGITVGCGSDRFCPGRTLTREEAGAFFLRIDNRLDAQSLGLLSVDPPPDWPPPGDPPPIPPEEQE